MKSASVSFRMDYATIIMLLIGMAVPQLAVLGKIGVFVTTIAMAVIAGFMFAAATNFLRVSRDQSKPKLAQTLYQKIWSVIVLAMMVFLSAYAGYHTEAVLILVFSSIITACRWHLDSKGIK